MLFASVPRKQAMNVAALAAMISDKAISSSEKLTLIEFIPDRESVYLMTVTSEVTMFAELREAEVYIPEGEHRSRFLFLVDSQRLHNALKAIAAKHIQLTRGGPDESCLVIRADRDEFVIPCVSPTDFNPPVGPLEEPEAEVPLEALARIFAETKNAAADQASRYSLNGVLLELAPRQHRAIATDNRRLAIAAVPTDDNTRAVTETKALLLPRAMSLLAKAASFKAADTPVQVYPESDRVIFQIDNIMLGTQRVSGEFPLWDRIVPDPELSEHQVKISTKGFLEAVASAKALRTSKDTGAMRFVFRENEIVISCHSLVYEWSSTKVYMTYQEKKEGEVDPNQPVGGFGDNFGGEEETQNQWQCEVYMDPDLLIDGLKAVDWAILTVYLYGSDKPVMFRADGRLEGTDENVARFVYLMLPILPPR